MNEAQARAVWREVWRIEDQLDEAERYGKAEEILAPKRALIAKLQENLPDSTTAFKRAYQKAVDVLVRARNACDKAADEHAAAQQALNKHLESLLEKSREAPCQK
jgi:alkylhydroperoxidase family enzyme